MRMFASVSHHMSESSTMEPPAVAPSRASRRRLYTLHRQLLRPPLTTAGPAAAPVAAAAPPPHGLPGPAVANNNVIVFFTDQQRFDTSSLHGNPMGLTPNFDRMARRGTHIAEAVTCQPVCGPARSAFQTGQWPTTNGCFKNNIALPSAGPKIGELFRDAGFNTGATCDLLLLLKLARCCPAAAAWPV